MVGDGLEGLWVVFRVEGFGFKVQRFKGSRLRKGSRCRDLDVLGFRV